MGSWVVRVGYPISSQCTPPPFVGRFICGLEMVFNSGVVASLFFSFFLSAFYNKGYVRLEGQWWRMGR